MGKKPQKVGWTNDREPDLLLLVKDCLTPGRNQGPLHRQDKGSSLKPDIFPREVVLSPVVYIIGSHLPLYMNHY